jgi:cytochrome c biogenesis protein CcmG/thiol:disulfide interchange protein DsbE
VGQTAPPLALTLLGGGTADLSAYRGRPVWVTFMASWCPACQDELPLMEAYHAQLGDQLPIVLVDVREDAATAASFAKSLKLDLPIALDTGGRAQRSWGAYALPIHYWIDASGVVRAVGYGGLAPPQLKASIQTVLPGALLKP